jgi:hypothetical protein
MALFLAANVHQGEELFSVYSKWGKQCASQNILLFAHGLLMYLRALINGLVDLDPGVEFFSIAISYQQLLLLVIHVQIHA